MDKCTAQQWLPEEPQNLHYQIWSDGMLQGSGSGWNLVVMQQAFTATTAAQQNIWIVTGTGGSRTSLSQLKSYIQNNNQTVEMAAALCTAVYGQWNKHIVAQCQQQQLSSCSKKQQVTGGIQAESNHRQKNNNQLAIKTQQFTAAKR